MVKVKYNKKLVDITANIVAYLIAGAVYPVIKICDLYNEAPLKNYVYSKLKLKQS